MLSYSAVVKLKAVLIIDLIIVGAAVGAYVYLQSQGVVIGGGSGFVLSGLVISPKETFAGQPVQISVNVTNTGNLGGDTTLNLEVNGEVKESINVTLAGLNTCETVEFLIIEMDPGVYTVKIGKLTGSFTLTEAPPNTSKIVLSAIKATPYEVWPGEAVTISASAKNPASNADSLMVTLTVNGVPVESRLIEVAADSMSQVEFTINAPEEGSHKVSLNTLSSSFLVVPEGYHTLIVTRSGGGSIPLPFTLNGEKIEAFVYTAVLPEGEYKLEVPSVLDVGTGILGFSYWNGDIKNSAVTFTLDKRTTWVATYIVLSGHASCPSLYVWNGTGYSYITDVSNPGWLGYISHIDAEGDIIFSGGNPYDYVKIDKSLLASKDGYFDFTLSQQWDELFYLDSANLLVVDHPVGTDVYTSMTNYLNKGSTGQIYTTATDNLLTPVSAINEKGQDVIEAILWQDGIFTPGINGVDSLSWDNIVQNQLTLNLGDLSEAPEIKLVLTGMVDWGLADAYYNWIEQFKAAYDAGLIAGDTQIILTPTMEILTADGTWIAVPQDRQMPIPSDYTSRTFTVDLTGLFPNDVKEYVVRFTNFWNVTYDYIGIDITTQQDITITTLKPTSAELGIFWGTTGSESSGAFTRYGDVTVLVQETDDMFVIGRQCDQVNLQFYIEDLPELAEGMERDYFFVVACWFKDPPEAWGYGFTYTVDPLPFLNMTGFPYTNAESYPYDEAHLAYLKEYNTRIIP